MIQSTPCKAILALVLLAIAVVCYIKLSPVSESLNENGFFYDLQEQKLFVAPITSIPPATGMKGAPLAGVRAFVISTTGNPADKKHRQIAYLQKYSPELKRLFEEVQQARAAGRSEAGRIDRSQIPANTLVRRLHDPEWYPLDSAEGEKITTEWNVPGPDGQSPAICSP